VAGAHPSHESPARCWCATCARYDAWQVIPAALLRGDLATVLAVVRQGVDSPEHADFVTRLQGA
jgi:hypothetical protein